MLVCPRLTRYGTLLSSGLGWVDEGVPRPRCSLQYQYTTEWCIQVLRTPKWSQIPVLSLAVPTKRPISLSKEGRGKEKSEARAGLGERPHCAGGGSPGWLAL